jgi:hypothetical protein
MNHTLRAKLIACLALSLSFFLIMSQAWGWGPGGHMIVAQIAYGRLNSKAKAEVDKLIALQIDPAEITKNSLDFVNASHWPDDLRPVPAFHDTLGLHYVDFPFSGDGTALPLDLPEAQNIITALTNDLEILKSSTDDNARAQALRFIIHFVGDIHQPLHCAARVTEALPEGDRGGNLFDLTDSNKKNDRTQKVNLHSYWDGGIGDFPKAGPNFTPPPLDQIGPAVERITAEFPDTDDGWKAGGPSDFAGWAKESAQLAQRVAYEGIQPNRRPSGPYNQIALQTVHKRVAWGGYRLAELLNSIWPEQ